MSDEVQNVETETYEDGSGHVSAETVITLQDTELVVVEYEGETFTHDVYERDIGETYPHTKHTDYNK